MSRVRLFFSVVGGLVALILVVFAFQVWGFYRLIKNGDVAFLQSLQYVNRLTVSDSAPMSAVVTAEVATKDDPKFGNDTAQIQVVEFADFGCPFSKEESVVLRELTTKYPEVIQVQYRDFPLTELHPGADSAALAATCADGQGKFWAMHDKLFANPTAFKDADLNRYATEIGLDAKKFKTCLAAPATAKELADDVAAGQAAGVRGTPTFFINGYKIEGAIPAEAWEKIVALAQKK